MVVTPTFLRWFASLLRVAAVLAVAFVLAGLLGFLTDEVRDSSQASTTRITVFNPTTQKSKIVDITQPDPPADVERAREKKHSGAREFIDDVGDVLMSPFSWVAGGSRAWVQRLVDSGLALLIYGALGLFLADRMRRWGDEIRRDAITRAEAAAAATRRESGTYVSPA